MIRQCHICGKEFDGEPHSKYCSDCKIEAKRARQRRQVEIQRKLKALPTFTEIDPQVAAASRPKEKIRQKACLHCGKSFFGHFNCKYCDDCRKVVQREQHRLAARKRREQSNPDRQKTLTDWAREAVDIKNNQ